MMESLKLKLSKRAVGDRIRQIRGDRTQKEFADIANATQSYISDLERGKCFPSVSFLGLLVELSGKSYDWILTGVESIAVQESVPEMAKKEVVGMEEDATPLYTDIPHIDYNYLKGLIIFIKDAPPTEKGRFLKILVSYLITYL